MMAVLISNSGKREEIPYYQIEQRCIEIVQTLDTEKRKEFEDFKKNYGYFAPYFDFVVMRLGYTIENPMGYDNCLLVFHDDKFYILEDTNYEKYCAGYAVYSEYHFFGKCDDITLNTHKISTNLREFPEDIQIIQNGIIDRQNNFLAMSNLRFHQNLAKLIVNQLIIKSKNIYNLFLKYQDFVTREMNFLEDKLGYIRLGIVDNIVYPCYRKSLISEEQNQFIKELEEKQYIEKYIGDKDYAEHMERNIFKSKKGMTK